jgi:hypothetical protein
MQRWNKASAAAISGAVATAIAVTLGLTPQGAGVYRYGAYNGPGVGCA